MKRRVIVQVVLVVSLMAFIWGGVSSAQEIKKENCFFLSSLHYTAKGMGYWYDKANGGLEIISGVPYSNLGCKNCHTPGCDRCHKVVKNGKSEYLLSDEEKKVIELTKNEKGKSKFNTKTTSNSNFRSYR